MRCGSSSPTRTWAAKRLCLTMSGSATYSAKSPLWMARNVRPMPLHWKDSQAFCVPRPPADVDCAPPGKRLDVLRGPRQYSHRRDDHRRQHIGDARPHGERPSQARTTAWTYDRGWQLPAADHLTKRTQQIPGSLAAERQPAARSAEDSQHDQDQRTDITIIDAEGLADIAEAPTLRDRELER